MANDSYSRGNRNDPYGRGGSGDSVPSTDPLTELARLIGQSDPFADAIRRESHQPDPHAYDDAARDDRYADPADARQYEQAQHYDERGYARADGHAADPHADQRYADQPYDQQHYDDPHDVTHAPGAEMFAADPQVHDAHSGEYHGGQPDDLARFYDDDEPSPRRRGWLAATVVTIVVAGVVGVASAVAYRSVFPGGPPALITRDPGPNKIVPSQTADSSANKAIDRLAAAGPNEKFVSHEEQPMQLPPAPAPGQNAGIPPMPGIGPAPQTVPADTAAIPPSGPNAPRKIKTTPIRPDTSGPVDAQPAPRAVPPAPPSRAQAQTVPPPAPHNSGGPLSLSPQGVANAPPAPAPAPVQPAAPLRTTALAPPAPITGGGSDAAGGPGYYVQVSAQRSHDEAQSSFRSLQSKYGNLLSGRPLVVHKKDVPGKGVFYGAWVGPMSRQDAAQLCDGLKAAGGPCMLQHN